MRSFAKLPSWLLPRRQRASSDSIGLEPKGPTLASTNSTLSCASAGSTCTEDSEGPRVSIDAVTEVPYDLYLNLVAAGRCARARGQHRKVRPQSQSRSRRQGVREPSRRKTRLVSCEVGTP